MRGEPKTENLKKSPSLKRPHALAIPCLPTVHHEALSARSIDLVVRTVLGVGLGALLRGYDHFGTRMGSLRASPREGSPRTVGPRVRR